MPYVCMYQQFLLKVSGKLIDHKFIKCSEYVFFPLLNLIDRLLEYKCMCVYCNGVFICILFFVSTVYYMLAYADE